MHSYGAGEVGFLREFDSIYTSLWQKRHLRGFCLSLEISLEEKESSIQI